MQCLLPCLLASTSFAQDLGVHAAPQSKPIALTGCTIHPVSGPAIENGFIAFEHGKIVDIGAMSAAKQFVNGTQVIDLKGRHVWPGMISPFTRLGLTEMGMTRPSQDFNEAGDVTPEVIAATAVNPDSTLIPVARANGVLIAGVFPNGGLLPGRVSVISTDGWTTETLTIRRDCGQALEWPFMRTVRAPWMDQTDEQQGSRTRESLERIRETFRTAKAYLAAKDADKDGVPTDLRWEAMRASLTAKAPVFVQAAEYDQIVAAVAFAREFNLKIVIVGGRDATLAAGLLKEHDIPVVFSGVMSLPHRDDSNYDESFSAPARLAAAGVKFCLASGEETPHERNLPYSAGMAVAHGLDADLAYRSLTLSSAEILGVADRVGSLEKGKDATIIVTDGNPMLATTHVLGAYIDGRVIDLNNKQSTLADKYREKYKQMKSTPSNGGGTAMAPEDAGK